ncbi:MAG: hypothetical protein KME26_13905 [Oscillatoria princeps RMCB-10]|nr:hypothetical protein [Oscillatoria princeps RMCB-10]
MPVGSALALQSAPKCQLWGGTHPTSSIVRVRELYRSNPPAHQALKTDAGATLQKPGFLEKPGFLTTVPVGSTHAHINSAGGFRPSATVCAQMPTLGRNPPYKLCPNAKSEAEPTLHRLSCNRPLPDSAIIHKKVLKKYERSHFR